MALFFTSPNRGGDIPIQWRGQRRGKTVQHQIGFVLGKVISLGRRLFPNTAAFASGCGRTRPAKLASFFAVACNRDLPRLGPRARPNTKLASYENAEPILWNQRLTEGRTPGIGFVPQNRRLRRPRGRRAGQGAPQRRIGFVSVIFIRVGDRPPVMDVSFFSQHALLAWACEPPRTE